MRLRSQRCFLSPVTVAEDSEGAVLGREGPDDVGVDGKARNLFSLAVICEGEGADTKTCRTGVWSSFNKAKDLALQCCSSFVTGTEVSEGAVLDPAESDRLRCE